MTAVHLPAHLRRVVACALAAWVAVLIVLLLAPTSEGSWWLVDKVATVADRVGAPVALAAPERVEFGLNVVAFIPLSFLSRLLWSRPSWSDWTAWGFTASFTVELVQAVALQDRFASHADVVANTLGALVGAVLGGLVVLGTPSRGASEGRADLPDRLPAAE